MKESFLTNLNFDSLHVVNREIIAFLESVPDYEGKFVHKIAKQLLRYAEQACDRKKDMADNEKKFIVSKLFELRRKFYINYKTVTGT